MSIDLLKLVAQAPAAENPSRASAAASPKGAGAQVASDFGKLLQENMDSLVDVTTKSDRMDRDFAAGKTDNIHEVMVAAAQANLALETAMQVRNIAVRAYQTLTQLR